MALFVFLSMQEEQAPKPSSRDYQLLGLKIIGDFGASIAVPVVLFVLAGQFLDKKYATGPWLTISAFILSAFVSAKIIHKKATRYGIEYKQLNDASKNTSRANKTEEQHNS